MFKLIDPPKRWISVTVPVLTSDLLNPAFLHRCCEMVLVTMFKISVMILGLMASSSLIWIGKLSTHWRMGLIGKTSSTRWIAVSAIRLPPQLGQKPRRLHEKATRCSLGQDSHLDLKKPWAKIPHFKYSRNSFSTKSGKGLLYSSFASFRKVSRFSWMIL